jgi:hypothetical protein
MARGKHLEIGFRTLQNDKFSINLQGCEEYSDWTDYENADVLVSELSTFIEKACRVGSWGSGF